MSEFRKELEELINAMSLENDSDTPDFVLAEYLQDCLDAFNRAVNKRNAWYNRVEENREIKLDNKEIFVYVLCRNYSGGLVFVTKEKRKTYDEDTAFYKFIGTLEEFSLSLIEDLKRNGEVLYYEYIE